MIQTAVAKISRSGFLAARLPLSHDVRVLDVGANPLTNPPYKALLDEGHCRLWGFEPLPSAFAELQAQKGAHETYFPFALGDGDEHDLHISNSAGLTSLFPFAHDRLAAYGLWPRARRTVRTERIATVRLDDIAELPPVDCLKIDVQGAEKSIIENGKSKLAEAMVLMPEMRLYQIYENEPSFGDVDAIIRDLGFVFHKFHDFNAVKIASQTGATLRPRVNQSQLIDADAVYVRSLTDPDGLSNHQISALALLADAVFASFDLVCLCMEILLARGAIDDGVVSDYLGMLPAQLRRV